MGNLVKWQYKTKFMGKFQIDQSGKIEQTNKNTVLCLSNDEWDAVLIKARSKRQIQEIFRRNGQIRNYVIFTFCAGLSLLIKRNLKIGKVVVDREYYGKEAVIKKILLEMLSRKRIPEIAFESIGRKARAHSKAYLIYSKRLKANRLLKPEEILKEIKMTEVGKRLKNA